MKITGWGLKGETLADVEVTVDGVPCSVTSSDKETITCVTGAASAPSLDGVSQPGSPGLSQSKMSSSNPTWEMRTDGSVAPYENSLQTNFENHFDSEHTMASVSKGWFKAPEAGNYRFYISCDNKCKLFLDSTSPFNAASPVEPTLAEVASRHWETEWRHYFITPEVDDINQYITEWVPLQAGEFYKIEGYMMEWTSSDHFTVSVEFEQADSTSHHHATKEIQKFSIEQTNVAEIFEISISGDLGGSYKIQFVNPKYDPESKEWDMFWRSELISDDCSAGTMYDHISDYFSSVWGSNISVVKTMYNDLDTATTDTALAVRSVYTVEVLKRIDGPSHNSAAILPDDSTAIVSMAMVQESSIPLSGSFKITCPDENGGEWPT